MCISRSIGGILSAVLLFQTAALPATPPKKTEPGIAWNGLKKNAPGLPPEFLSFHGVIQEFYPRQTKGKPSPLVILLQDIHGQWEVQKNQASLLSDYQRNAGLTLVGMEGARGPFSTGMFRGWPWPPGVFRTIAEGLMRGGHITGPEYFGLTGARLPELWGVESESLYLENIEAYRRSVKYRIEDGKALDEMEKRLLSQKTGLFPPALRELDALIGRYAEGAIGLKEYADALQKTPAYAQGKYPQLKKLLSLIHAGADGLSSLPQSDPLAAELENLSVEAPLSLAQTREEKTLCRLSLHIRLLKKLASFTLTSSEWDFYSRLRTRGPALPAGLPFYEAFYRTALARNRAMARSLSDRMAATGTSRAVLVAGGFHTDGLKDEFLKRGFSVAVATPRVDRLEHNGFYLDALSGGRTPLERALTGENSFLQAPLNTAAQGFRGFPRKGFLAVLAGLFLLVSAQHVHPQKLEALRKTINQETALALPIPHREADRVSIHFPNGSTLTLSPPDRTPPSAITLARFPSQNADLVLVEPLEKRTPFSWIPGVLAFLAPGWRRKRNHFPTLIRHVPTDRQIVYVQTLDEMAEALAKLYAEGITDENRPYIHLVDENGEPWGVIEQGSILIPTNHRPDRKKGMSRLFLKPGEAKTLGFQLPRNPFVTLISSTKDIAADYVAIFKENIIPDPLAEVLLKSQKAVVSLYASGEKIEHMCGMFFRGGLKKLFSNERIYIGSTPKVQADIIKNHPKDALLQGMIPIAAKFMENVRQTNSPVATLHLADDQGRDVTLSGVIDEEGGDEIVVTLMDNYRYFSDKNGAPVPWTGQNLDNIDKLSIPRSNVRSIEYDRDKEYSVHAINIGAPDLVGHAANPDWSRRCLEMMDAEILGPILKTLDDTGTLAIFTADHGNIEQVVDIFGGPQTSHTSNPVGVSIRLPARNGEPARFRQLNVPRDTMARLDQIYPTILKLLEIPIPGGKNQTSLLDEATATLKDLIEQDSSRPGPRNLALVVFDGLAPPDPLDDESPYNAAEAPLLKEIFNNSEARPIARAYAHGEYVGVLPPTGKTAEKLADYIAERGDSIKGVFLPRHNQFFADLFVRDAKWGVEKYLKKTYMKGKHYKRFKNNKFNVHSFDHILNELTHNPFYQTGENGTKRFAIVKEVDGILFIKEDLGNEGGSEHGHSALGTGTIDPRPIFLFEKLLDENGFFDLETHKLIMHSVTQEISKGVNEAKIFNIRGFLQDSGVHGSTKHIKAWVELLHRMGVPSQNVRLFLETDGRDEPPDAGLSKFNLMRNFLEGLGQDTGVPYGRIVSIGPRSNDERDDQKGGRLLINYHALTKGRIPSSLFFEIDEQGGAYSLKEFNLLKGWEFIRAYRQGRYTLEISQAREHLELITQYLTSYMTRYLRQRWVFPARRIFSPLNLRTCFQKRSLLYAMDLAGGISIFKITTALVKRTYFLANVIIFLILSQRVLNHSYPRSPTPSPNTPPSAPSAVGETFKNMGDALEGSDRSL
jgi:bisphosphoglycerate-independent phosphoglycerate mutase (AlkP superfamily)